MSADPSSRPFAVRQATPLDIAELDALMARSYAPLLRDSYPPSVLVVALPRIARAQPALLASGHYFVAEDAGGRIVGAGGWSRGSPHASPQGNPRGRAGDEPSLARSRLRTGHVRHVATDVRHARQGIGRALIGAVVDDALHDGVTRLHCLSTLNAVPFYRAMGFVPRRTVSLSFGAAALAFSAVEMERDL